MFRIVPMAIDVPYMVNATLLEKLVNILADPDQSIFVATRDPKQLELCLGFINIRYQLLSRFGIRSC